MAGCGTTQYIYVRPKPFAFQKIPPPKVRHIRVYKDDVPLYKGYILNFRKIIDFYNKQIDDYKKTFGENNGS